MIFRLFETTFTLIVLKQFYSNILQNLALKSSTFYVNWNWKPHGFY